MDDWLFKIILIAFGIFVVCSLIYGWGESAGRKNGAARAIFYTTAQLSETAKKYAKYLNVEVIVEPMTSYPLIKCNVGKNGEKIYHLPFDQQYDRLFITTSKGDKYVETVSEAEEIGFRRAYRWKGGN